MAEPSQKGLLVLWVSQDKGAAQNMVFMYTKNSKLKGWWNDVRLIIWGPSAVLLANDEDLQKELQELMAAGVELFACKRCADNYGVSEKLAGLGVEVEYMGEPFTSMLKEGWVTVSV